MTLRNRTGSRARPSIKIRSYLQGEFLVLEVTDNGIGIEEKNAKIIFTAGYTTKKQGSGLGLHSTANFIVGSGGQIYPLSDGIGKGTTMRIKLRLSSVTSKTESGARNGKIPSRRRRVGRATNRAASRPLAAELQLELYYWKEDV